MRFGSRFLLSTAFLAMFAGVGRADVKKRWELDFDHERPEHYTFRSPMGHQKTYWYVVWRVTNNTPQACPLIVDVSLHVDGRNWQTAGFYPVEENAIIAEADRMGGYSVGIQKELIEDFKKRRKYLNKGDMRKVGVLQAGESVHCLSIFEDKGYRYNDVEVMVSGLVDPVTYKWIDRGEGKQTSSSNIHLQYENRVFRLTYNRDGDQFFSFRRGLTLTKHDWVVVGINPAVTKSDIASLVSAMTNDDPLIRRVAQDLLIRYTAAARKDMDLVKLLSEDPKDKVEALKQAKEVLSALAKMKGWQQNQALLFSSLKDQLISRIPEIPAEIANLKPGGELNSDQIKSLTDQLKVVVTHAREKKCPIPSYVESVMTRENPTSQVVYDWICGYEDKSIKDDKGNVVPILYPGVQQWKEFITDITDTGNEQQKNFEFIRSLFESLEDPTITDPWVRDVAISVLKDVATDERMTVDVTAYDPKIAFAEQKHEIKDAIWRWREWWSRNRDESYWNGSTKSFEPKKK
ncbi:MAG: hypothetical protein FD180_5185 [Planctomycetota bacterium]|nr:MAG: hypothetical protein FD180_5185 [Planctomycetota bacterium]